MSGDNTGACSEEGVGVQGRGEAGHPRAGGWVGGRVSCLDRPLGLFELGDGELAFVDQHLVREARTGRHRGWKRAGTEGEGGGRGGAERWQ